MARVLLVDDDPVILRLLEVNFRLEGFETLMASRGEEALQMAAEHRPDAVVLDVMLPGIDGHEVFRRFRADPDLAAIPIVFLSARSRDEVLGKLDPDVDYVTKPFDPVELIALIRARMDPS